MKLILLKGLPASGKSTRAREIVATGNWIRVNKDDLRNMLHNKWSSRNEEVTFRIERIIAQDALTHKLNVVVDDTNFHPKVISAWKEVAKTNNAVLEIERFDTSIEECIRRDLERGKNGGRSVGQYVIKNMARQYRLQSNGKKDVLCDLDGTLCDIKQRLHYVKDSDQKNWAAFFSDIPNDKLRVDVVIKLAEYRNTHNIVLVSARPDTYRSETEKWLAQYLPFSFDTLIMRRGSDSRDDSIVKKEILDTYFDKENIEIVFDDRPRVIRMWRENGIKVEDVGSGIEF